jgi:hypothetical protein
MCAFLIAMKIAAINLTTKKNQELIGSHSEWDILPLEWKKNKKD